MQNILFTNSLIFHFSAFGRDPDAFVRKLCSVDGWIVVTESTFTTLCSASLGGLYIAVVQALVVTSAA